MPQNKVFNERFISNEKKQLEMKQIFYDSKDDSLTFIRDNSGVETINTGFTLITLNEDKRITALELMGANKNFRIPSHILNTITGAKVVFSYEKDKKIIILKIFIQHKDDKETIMWSEDVSKIKGLMLENQKMSVSIA